MPSNLSLEETNLIKEMLRGEISKTSNLNIDIDKLRDKLNHDDYSYFFNDIPTLIIEEQKFNQAIEKYSTEIKKMFSKLADNYIFKDENPELAHIYYNYYKNFVKSKIAPLKIENFPSIKEIFSLIYFDPIEVNSWINQAFIFERFGLYEQAIKCFRNALIINPSYIALWIYQSEDFEKMNKYNQAADCIKEAIRLSPYNSDLWIKKWRIEYEKQKYYNFRIGRMKDSIRKSDLSALVKMTKHFGYSILTSLITLVAKQEALKEDETLICRKCSKRYRFMSGLIKFLCPICTSIKNQEEKVEKKKESTPIIKISK